MKIILNDNEVKHIIHDAFCNSTGVYGALKITYDDVDYEEAKKALKENKEPSLFGSGCIEDVWLKMLEMGKTLYLVDWECMEKEAFNYESIKEKLNSGDGHLAKMIMESLEEEGDSITADNLLQYMVYGDIVYC